MKNTLLFIVTILFLDTYAQWNTDVYTNTAICTASFKQKEIRLDSDSDGGAFIVWRDYRSGSVFEEPDIYIQKVDSNGYAEWTINGREICVLPYNQGTPGLTKDENGGVIITWTDRRNNVADIYAQRIDANGNILWALNGVPVVEKINSEHSPKVISDDNSGIIAVWEDQRWDADSTYNIWAQRIDSNGNAVWTSGGIPVCPQDSNRINHKVQRDGDGGAIITWQDGRKGPGDYDIWAQHLDPLGNYIWPVNGIAVCGAVGNQTNPKIDPEKSADGIFVSWIDKRNGVDYDIYCNRIDSNGTPLWGVNGKPVVTATNNQSALDILSNNKTQGVIVTWKDKRSSEYDIYVQKLDMDGNPVWGVDGIAVCTAIGDQLNPNIISDKNGGAIIVWQDERSFDWDVYTQRVSYNGNMVWQYNGAPVCLAVGDQTSPKNIPDNKGGCIVSWEDKRNGSKDIYMHHLLFEDTVTYPQDSIPADTVSTLVNELLPEFNIYPNPFDQDIFIQGEFLDKCSFELINILGEKIDVAINVISNQKVHLESEVLSKGVYFVLIKHDDFQSVLSLRK